jgi:DNA repair ATPase RecN
MPGTQRVLSNRIELEAKTQHQNLIYKDYVCMSTYTVSEKTKVTLYLEEDLVGRAKKSDLNMSKIANNALKQQFGLGKETSRQKNLREILQDIEEDGRLHSFGFKIGGLELENIGKFDELSLEFQDGLNVIHGPNASGKSTIIRGIANAVTPGAAEFRGGVVKRDQASGSVDVRLEDPAVFRQFGSDPQYDSGENGVLLLGAPFARLSHDHAQEMVEQLKRDIDSQIILTTINEELAGRADNSIRIRSFTEERLEEVQEELQEVESKLGERRERLRQVSVEIDELESEIEAQQTSKLRLDSLGDEKENILESIEQTEMYVSDLNEELGSVDERLENTESEREIGMLEERRENLSEKLTQKSEQLEEYSERLEEVETNINELEDVSEQLQDLRASIGHKRDLRRKLQEEVEVLQDKAADLSQEQQDIQEGMEVSR